MWVCVLFKSLGRDSYSAKTVYIHPCDSCLIHTSCPASLSPAGLRQGPIHDLLADRVFSNAINVAIAATRDAYERMAFREALKAAAYELGNARDMYRYGTRVGGWEASVAPHKMAFWPSGPIRLVWTFALPVAAATAVTAVTITCLSPYIESPLFNRITSGWRAALTACTGSW